MKPRAQYSLPFKPNSLIRRCTATSHFRKNSQSRCCIDFYMPPGTPVVAARNGVVVHRESRCNTSYGNERWQGSGGNGVILRHADGEETLYWHALWKSVKARVGQRVRRGQILFLSGQTGYATYPHTHFGIYDGKGEKSRGIPAGKNIVPDFRYPLPTKVSYKKYE